MIRELEWVACSAKEPPHQLCSLPASVPPCTRYAWFGEAEECRAPSPEFEARFLEYVPPKAPDWVSPPGA